MSKVFISYSRKNINFVNNLVAAIRKDGYSVWFDKTNIEAGMKWAKEIEEAIETCIAFVIIMSPDADDSEWVENELLYALDKKRFIIPILYDGEAFMRLRSVQFVDMQGQTGENLPEDLKAVLKKAYQQYLDTTKTTIIETVSKQENSTAATKRPKKFNVGEYIRQHLFETTAFVASVVTILGFALQFLVLPLFANPTQVASASTPEPSATMTITPTNTPMPTATPIATITPSADLDIPLDQSTFEMWASEQGLSENQSLTVLATQQADYLARLSFPILDDSDWCLYDDSSGIIQNIQTLADRDTVMMFVAIDENTELRLSLYDLVAMLPSNIRFTNYGYAEIETLRQFVVLIVESPDDISGLSMCYVLDHE